MPTKKLGGNILQIQDGQCAVPMLTGTRKALELDVYLKQIKAHAEQEKARSSAGWPTRPVARNLFTREN